MLELNHHIGGLKGNLLVLANKASDISDFRDLSASGYAKKKQDKDGSNLVVLPVGDQLHAMAVFNPKKKEADENKLEDLRKLGNQCIEWAQKEKIETLQVALDDKFSDAYNMAFLEGMVLGWYAFNTYKTKSKPHPTKGLEVLSGTISQAHLDELAATAEGVFLARDLVNEPVITLSATEFSKRMSKAGKEAGFTTTVLEKSQIEALKMGGLLGVNYGSVDPPTFNIMEHKPKNAVNDKPLVLVGKGVVYDTGGSNLKPGAYMLTMKSDMGGGAAVTGAMYAISKNKLPLWVIGLVPATDNRIGKNALVPDDVITMSNGTTVEVKNTDAEGRLILADALVYAKKYDPELVIDLATLTGAAEAITSHFGIASMGTADKKTKNKLAESGDQVYERLAEMPYWREYDKLLDSSIADISNLGGPKGGAITAGKFLETFTDYPWIHLDIAGPAYLNSAVDYRPTGGTGAGVRLLYHFAKTRCKK